MNMQTDRLSKQTNHQCYLVRRQLPEPHNNCPAYKQRSTLKEENSYLYRAVDGNWYIYNILGGDTGFLQNQERF